MLKGTNLHMYILLQMYEAAVQYFELFSIPLRYFVCHNLSLRSIRVFTVLTLSRSPVRAWPAMSCSTTARSPSDYKKGGPMSVL